MTSHKPYLPLLAILIVVGCGMSALPATAQPICSETTAAMLLACYAEVKDDFFEATAICVNVTDPTEQAECLEEANAEREEATQACPEVAEARQDLCEELGEEAYDPDFDPADFLSSKEAFNNANAYYPLAIGNEWHYEGGGEKIDIFVLDESKLIEDVTCIVVNDKVFTVEEESGEERLVEDTDDWYAQNLDGTVNYCGEQVKDYEYFDGDIPLDPELISIEGSFKHGRDGAKTGTIMLAEPEAGDVYRLEFALGNAEDAAEVLSSNYFYDSDLSDKALNRFVPPELARALCSPAAPCLVTLDFTPLDPDVEERKYYAPGIGVFLEVDLETGDIHRLVDCNLAACSALP